MRKMPDHHYEVLTTTTIQYWIVKVTITNLISRNIVSIYLQGQQADHQKSNIVQMMCNLFLIGQELFTYRT